MGGRMSGKNSKVHFNIDCGDVKELTAEDIKAILRAADALIAAGGRSLLAKVLKGSRDKSVLTYKLDQSPAYGYYRELKLEHIINRIDWMIRNNYLEVIYSGRLPLLVYSEKGWELERETYAEELLQKLTALLETKDYHFVNELKEKNRSMILLLIGKIGQTGNTQFIPLLRAWQKNEYKKVRSAIQKVVDNLMEERSRQD